MANEQTSGPRTTADQEAEGRLIRDVVGRRKKKLTKCPDCGMSMKNCEC